MDTRIEYGIICQKDDEKELVGRINKFLKNEYGFQKMYKRKDESISAFNYEYYYCQFLHEKPLWYFDLYPNEDLDGKLKFDNPDARWILYVSKRNVNENTENQNVEVNVFFEKLIDATGYDTKVLHTYKDDKEERIGNDIFELVKGNTPNAENTALPDETSDMIDRLCEQGNEEMEDENFAKAIEYFNQAFELLPQPKDQWEASAWIYTSIGDAYFCMEQYETALDNFHKAYRNYGAENLNPFILLRLGQCNFHLNDEKNALEFLLRAYMLEGNEIFEDAEEYFEFLKKNVELDK